MRGFDQHLHQDDFQSNSVPGKYLILNLLQVSMYMHLDQTLHLGHESTDLCAICPNCRSCCCPSWSKLSLVWVSSSSEITTCCPSSHCPSFYLSSFPSSTWIASGFHLIVYLSYLSISVSAFSSSGDLVFQRFCLWKIVYFFSTLC